MPYNLTSERFAGNNFLDLFAWRTASTINATCMHRAYEDAEMARLRQRIAELLAQLNKLKVSDCASVRAWFRCVGCSCFDLALAGIRQTNRSGTRPRGLTSPPGRALVTKRCTSKIA